MRSYTFLVLLLLPFFILQGQVDPPKFRYGNVEVADFQKAEGNYPDASIIILDDRGESTYKYDQAFGFQLETRRHVRFKLMNEKGLSHLKQVLTLRQDDDGRENLIAFRGSVYTLNGTSVERVKMSKDDLNEEELDDLYKQITFQAKGVKPGDIVEYSYTIQSKDLSAIRPWYFQYDIPVLHSYFVLDHPEYFHLTAPYINGNQDLLKSDKKQRTQLVNLNYGGTFREANYQETVFKYQAINLPPFKPEVQSASSDNYKLRVHFQVSQFDVPGLVLKNLARHWEDIDSWLRLHEDFGAPLNRGNYMEEVIEQIQGTNTENFDLMQAGFEWIKNNIKWDGRSRAFISFSLKNTYLEKTGSSADVNLLLVTLLKKLGLNANPVLVSTRENEKLVRHIPSRTPINYVIVMVNIRDRIFLLDATEPNNEINVLPLRCLNGIARLTYTKPRWINLNKTALIKETCFMNMKIDTTGAIKGKTSIKYFRQGALEVRNQLASSPDQFIAQTGNQKQIKFSSYEILNQPANEKPIIIKGNIDYTVSGLKSAREIKFFPMAPSSVELPFTAESRNYPVDFGYKQEYNRTYAFRIPPGYQIIKYPENRNLITENYSGEYTLTVSVSNNILHIKEILKLNEPIYSPQQYEELQILYKEAQKAWKEEIILKKSLPN